MAPRRTTTARGYGYQHRKARTAALRAMRDGDPCSRCSRPMHHTQRLELDHTDDRAGYQGLAHATCNRAAGARKGNRQRRGRLEPALPRRTRAW